MSKIDEAKEILKELGLPAAQQNEISAYTLLALCDVKPRDNWSKATKASLKVSKGIMAFCKTCFICKRSKLCKRKYRLGFIMFFFRGRFWLLFIGAFYF